MSHHRSCFNVAKGQDGCSATPFLLRFFHPMSNERFSRRGMHLVGFQAVHVNFAEDCSGAQGRIVAASRDINFPICYRRNREFYGVSGSIGGNSIPTGSGAPRHLVVCVGAICGNYDPW
jgi:hypothetical protein